jgi:hypothetical protein
MLNEDDMYFHHVDNNNNSRGTRGGGKTNNNSSVATNFNPLTALETYENFTMDGGAAYYINNGFSNNNSQFTSHNAT